jgi:hypothetical protein
MITNSTDFYGIYSLLTMRSVKRSPAGGRFWRLSAANHKCIPSLRSSFSTVYVHLIGLAVWL